MSKIKILFFAADPLSAQPDGRGRLALDEDVRQICRHVRAAGGREDLFGWRLAARPDDLLQALKETRPRVVHFSGHGLRKGLLLVGSDGCPHLVPAAGLAQLFQVYRGRIRLVVLNACFSLEQAEALAGVVGCAIGTRSEISDAAAITFGAEFYSAVVNGRSVKDAFELASAALRIKHPDDAECPELVTGDGVDPSRLYVHRPYLRVVAKRVAALVLAVATMGAVVKLADRTPESLAARPDCGWEGGGSARNLAGGLGIPAAASSAPIDPSAGSDLSAAKILYREGSYQQAIPLFRRAAEAGIPEAMAFLGVVYMRGQGTVQEPDSAFRWLHDAALKRDPLGMTELGLAYQNGVGTRRNRGLAVRWYENAVNEKGSAEAMRRLGGLFRDEQNFAAALHWFRAAVLSGSSDARADAGWMYEKGLGVSADPEEARCLYDMAAHAGSLRGMLAMGRIYQDAVGVPQDYEQAKEWYLRAVSAGSAEAMYSMGVLHQNGWGVPQNRTEALRWFRRARDAGSRIAAGTLAAQGVW